jgi:lipopolysaccharide/colanic/teichoic acid biosynthesis glycosyltransferase
MVTAFRPRTLVLFLGDALSFVLALWVSLYVRAFELPLGPVFAAHLVPFSLLFVVWVAVFFIAGLYENRSILLARRALSATLLIAQTINVSIAALFFFFVPLFGIAPKTILVIYLAISFLLVLGWRVFIFPRLGVQKPESAVVVGEGREVAELVSAMRAAHRSPVLVAEVVPVQGDLSRAVFNAMERHQARVIIADFTDPQVSQAFPQMYNLISLGVRFFDAMAVYEELFGRIPLKVLNDEWLARNVSRYAHTFYDTLKRAMDIALALPAALISLIFYPFIIAAIKLEDGGDIFISQDRVGQDNRLVRMYKFRSMTGNDSGNYGEGGTTKLRVTRVGAFLRSSRLDELPQLWGVLRGNLSLIGPRFELPALVEQYEQQIPYYRVRHLIKPGLSGWAQLYHHVDPHHATNVEETRAKLSYDLYYLKHRSLLLDLTIALKTIRRILMRGNA